MKRTFVESTIDSLLVASQYAANAEDLRDPAGRCSAWIPGSK